MTDTSLRGVIAAIATAIDAACGADGTAMAAGYEAVRSQRAAFTRALNRLAQGRRLRTPEALWRA